MQKILDTGEQKDVQGVQHYNCLVEFADGHVSEELIPDKKYELIKTLRHFQKMCKVHETQMQPLWEKIQAFAEEHTELTKNS